MPIKFADYFAGLLIGEVEAVGGDDIFVHLSERSAVFGYSPLVGFLRQVDAVKEPNKVVPHKQIAWQKAVLGQRFDSTARNG